MNYPLIISDSELIEFIGKEYNETKEAIVNKYRYC
jgi:hypothetical protein